LQFGLLSKEDALENLESLLPFFGHKNMWVRQAAKKYVDYLQDPKNKILTSAEAYCLVRPVVKKALKQLPPTASDDDELSRFNLKANVFEGVLKTSVNSNQLN
jgi:hypothetical protein